MDFSSEPPHSSLLVVRGKEPCNAEPTAAALIEFPLTPDDLVFCRNHGPIREFDPDSYIVSFKGIERDAELSINQIKSLFTKVEVVSVLQCAGIRRREMGKLKPVHGVPWSDGVVANCRWGGARLRDVLQHLNLLPNDNANDLHVCFASFATLCQDDEYYGSSIPLAKAIEMDPGVILAYEMNGEDLSPDHGAPLRVVVPGYLGARWVKWVDTISISPAESPNFYQQRDYKILPPDIETREAAEPLWSKYPAMTALPLNSVIGTVYKSSPDSLFIKGYALPGATGQVSAVEVSVDDGQTWVRMNITYQEGKLSWSIWEGQVACKAEHGNVWSRAIDVSGKAQPRDGGWNFRGVGFNGWGRASFFPYLYLSNATYSYPTPMGLGRLVHYAFDAVLVSTLLAGVRRSSGFSPNTSSISDSTFRGAAEKFLAVGESVFDVLQATAVNNSYFSREDSQRKS